MAELWDFNLLKISILYTLFVYEDERVQSKKIYQPMRLSETNTHVKFGSVWPKWPWAQLQNLPSLSGKWPVFPLKPAIFVMYMCALSCCLYTHKNQASKSEGTGIHRRIYRKKRKKNWGNLTVAKTSVHARSLSPIFNIQTKTQNKESLFKL